MKNIKGLSFTQEEFEQAMQNLKNAYFFKRDSKGKIIGILEEPPIEVVLEEIKFLQYKRKESNK